MGSEYIEFYNGSSWDRIIIEGFVSLDVLPVVNSNSDQTYKLNLHRELYPYIPGKYRVFKTVYPESVWNDKNNRDKHAINIASEFYMEFT